jgi:Flp pilus assembly protein TadB
MNKLDLLRPKKLFIVAAMVLLLTSTVGLVVTESPWYVLYALVPALLLTGHWYWPQRIRRRIKLLSEGANVISG